MDIRLSIHPVPGLSKDERADFTHFTKYFQCSFKQLIHLLTKDYMYSPFAFLGNHRLTSNICSTTQFVVIDVDSTSLTIHQRLTQLLDEDLQCIIGTTSSQHNLTKYRVLLPLSTPVTRDEYRRLIKGIQYHGLISDMDPASAKPAQVFYSYADSIVLSSFSGHPLIVEDYILPPPQPGEHSPDISMDLSELIDQVPFYPYASKGSRTRVLLRAGFELLELGASDQQLEQALTQLNQRFLVPKDQHSLKRRVINFIKSRR